jgi:hypothetical protein
MIRRCCQRRRFAFHHDQIRSSLSISNGTTTDFSNLAFGNAVVALGNGQQFIRRYAFILVSALDGKLGNDFCAVFAELL